MRHPSCSFRDRDDRDCCVLSHLSTLPVLHLAPLTHIAHVTATYTVGRPDPEAGAQAAAAHPAPQVRHVEAPRGLAQVPDAVPGLPGPMDRGGH